ncbi:unnamed protein product [Aphanomyces euteiches]
MEAANRIEAYEEDVLRTAASVIECISIRGRVDLVQLIQSAQHKPIAWIDDVVCTLESSGKVARVVVDAVEGWVLAPVGEGSSREERLPELGPLYASILCQRAAIHSRQTLATHVDIYASADPALQSWWLESDKERCIEVLETNLHTLNLLLETSSPESYVWSMKSSQNQWMLGLGAVFPCEDELVEYLAQDPLRSHGATTREGFSSLLQAYRLSLSPSSSFRHWWISSLEAPASVILREFIRRGILQLGPQDGALEWNVLSLIEQAFKIQSPQAERCSKPGWTLERVNMLREIAIDAFRAQAIQYTPSHCNFQVAAAETNGNVLQERAPTSRQSILNGILDNMTQKTELILAQDSNSYSILQFAQRKEDHACNESTHQVEEAILDPPRYEVVDIDRDIHQMKTNSDSDMVIIPDNLKRYVEKAEAIVSIVLDRIGRFPLSKMTKWINKLIKKQCLAISPDSFLNLVVAAVKPFAIVVQSDPVMFVKHAEIPSRSRFLADADTKQWSEQYIKSAHKKINKARSRLRTACESASVEKITKAIKAALNNPFHSELADDIADARNVINNLNHIEHRANDSITIKGPEPWENLSTIRNEKDVSDMASISEHEIIPSSEVALVLDGLEQNIQNCVAIVAIVLNKLGLFPLSKMMKWIKKLKPDQVDGKSPESILNIVTTAVKPFAKVSAGPIPMFLKDLENTMLVIPEVDKAANEFAQHYIQTAEINIETSRLKLRDACLEENEEKIGKVMKRIFFSPHLSKLAKEIRDARKILRDLKLKNSLVQGAETSYTSQSSVKQLVASQMNDPSDSTACNDPEVSIQATVVQAPLERCTSFALQLLKTDMYCYVADIEREITTSPLEGIPRNAYVAHIIACMKQNTRLKYAMDPNGRPAFVLSGKNWKIETRARVDNSKEGSNPPIQEATVGLAHSEKNDSSVVITCGPMNLDHSIQNCVAIIAIALNGLGYLAVSKLMKWINKLTPQQRDGKSPETFLDHVVAAIKPFAKVSSDKVPLFLKKNENISLPIPNADDAAEEFAKQHILKKSEAIEKERLSLRQACLDENEKKINTVIKSLSFKPYHTKFTKEIRDARFLLNNLKLKRSQGKSVDKSILNPSFKTKLAQKILSSMKKNGPLDYNIQTCAAIVAFVVNRIGFFPVPTMLKMIKMLTPQQRGSLWPEAFLDAVVVAVKPFAKVLPGLMPLFVKQQEDDFETIPKADAASKEWAEEFIHETQKEIDKKRLKLRKACEEKNVELITKILLKIKRTPSRLVLVEEVKDAQIILKALTQDESQSNQAEAPSMLWRYPPLHWKIQSIQTEGLH